MNFVKSLIVFKQYPRPVKYRISPENTIIKNIYKFCNFWISKNF